MELDQLCMGCMQDRGDLEVCSNCGFDERKPMPIVALPLRTELIQQYLVGRVLGSPGGFGVTYLGLDLNLKTPVAIKEYKPRGLVERAPDRLTIVPQSPEDEGQFQVGLQQFLDEARLVADLAQFNHPNIVRVRNFFKANGTGYMVMDYYRGTDLAGVAKQGGGRLQAKTARWVMMPILDGLRVVHEHGILHRDIKPQNIYITDRKQPVLLDFGAARDVSNGQSRGLTAIRTPGYAPYEQEIGGRQGAWTDIYACAATLYFLLSGKVPPAASERRVHDEIVPLDYLVDNVPSGMSDAIMRGLAVEPDQRPQTVQAFQELLMRDGELTTSTATIPPTVASIVVTCPTCNVTNSVPAGRPLTDTKCANCTQPLSVSVTTAAPVTSATTQQVSVDPTLVSMGNRKGQSIAIGALTLVLLLGGGLWAKQSYDKSLAEEQSKRLAMEQELKRKAEEAEKAAQEAKRVAEAHAQKLKEEEERRKDEETRRLAEEKTKQEAEARRLAEENERLRNSLQATSRPRVVTAPDPVDPELAEIERERKRALAKARAARAAEEADEAARRSEERAERRRREAEYSNRTPQPQVPTANTALPTQQQQQQQTDPTGGLGTITDIACKFWGKCDSRFK